MPFPPGRAPGTGSPNGPSSQQDAAPERRLSTDTGTWYTLAELRQEYAGRYTDAEIQDYWDKEMPKEQDDCNGEDGGGGASQSGWKAPEAPTLPHDEVVLEGHDGKRAACRYVLLKPPGFEARKEPWPVLLFLHGHGEIDRAALLCSLIVGEDALLDSFVLGEFLVLAPLASRGGALLDAGGHDFDVDAVHRLAQEAMSRLLPHVDPGRLSVTGYSMGADGALKMAARHGKSLAAVAAFAGAYSGLWYERWEAAMESFNSASTRCYHNEGDNYLWSRHTVTTVQWIGNPYGMSPSEDQDVSIPVKIDGPNAAEDLSSIPLRLSEYQWGRKACLLFARRKEDEVQDHDCWSFVYRNEATFHLFSWMLSCRAAERCDNSQVQSPIVTVEDARLDACIQRWLTRLWPRGAPSPGDPLVAQAHLDISFRIAVEWLTRADAIVVLSGAVLEAGSSVPACCGGSGAEWPALSDLDKTSEEVGSYAEAKKEPELAWGFWNYCLNACKKSEPRRCQRLLHEWASLAPSGAYCVTSSVDGSWARSGWPEEHVVEVRGALGRLQCAEKCIDETWDAPDDLGLKEDSKSHRVVGKLPKCPKCGALARPCARLYGSGWEGSLALPQEPVLKRYEAWHKSLREAVLSPKELQEAGGPDAAEDAEAPLQPTPGTVAVIELGCSAAELSSQGLDWMVRDFKHALKLIRVRPQNADTPDAWAGGTVYLPVDFPEAFDRLSELMKEVPMGRFVVVDGEGGGAEFVDRVDACRERIWRRALSEVGQDPPREAEADGVLLEASHPIVDNMLVALPEANAEVPIKYFHTQDGDLPLVKVKVFGHDFGRRSESLQARVQRVSSLLADLLAMFGSPAYQERVEAADDPEAIRELIREVHLVVLPEHGFPMDADMTPGQIHKMQLRMQALVQSGMVTSEIAEQGAQSSVLAGRPKMEELRQMRRKVKAAPGQASSKPSTAEVRAFIRSLKAAVDAEAAAAAAPAHAGLLCEDLEADQDGSMPSMAELLAQLDSEEGVG